MKKLSEDTFINLPNTRIQFFDFRMKLKRHAFENLMESYLFPTVDEVMPDVQII